MGFYVGVGANGLTGGGSLCFVDGAAVPDQAKEIEIIIISIFLSPIPSFLRAFL